MKTTSFVFGMAVIVAVVCSGVCAEKMKVDPNKNGGSRANLEVNKSAPDLRLSRNITYTSTNKRLHTVLEELSKETGVDIQAGKNIDDWPVRDIPLVVCVKGISLGKLLRAIADSSHLAMSVSTVKDVKHYRIWRNTKFQDQLSNYFKSAEEAKQAQLSAQWDAWAKLKEEGVPDNSSSSGSVDGEDLDTTEFISLTADVMSALPAGSKEAVLAGKMLSFDIKTASPQLAHALRAMYLSAGVYAKASYKMELSETSDLEEDSYRPKPPRDMTEAEMQKLKFVVCNQNCHDKLVGTVNIGGADSLSNLYVGIDNGSSRGIASNSIPVSGDLALFFLSGQFTRKVRMPTTGFSPSMHKLDPGHMNFAGADKIFTVRKPKDGLQRVFADLIVDIANASGFSIVCEDFQSHAIFGRSGDFPFYDKKIALNKLLISPDDLFDSTDEDQENAVGGEEWSSSDFWQSDIDWLVEPSSKLLVGLHNKWWAQHKSLAPEKVITDLIKKMDGDGLEIDDVAKTLLLPDDQYEEWIAGNKSFCFQNSSSSNFPPFWKIYAGLSDENKALAKSKDGLALADLNRADVLAAFSQYAENTASLSESGKYAAMCNWLTLLPEMKPRMREWRSELSSQENGQDAPDYVEMAKSLLERFPEAKAALEPPTDPAKIFKLRMKLRLTKRDYSSIPKQFADCFLADQHTCSLAFEGSGIEVNAGNLGDYPIYSDKRRDELVKEQQNKKSDKTK